MKRVHQAVKISDEVLRDVGVAIVPTPPDPWFVRGPRGGLYVATGARERSIRQTENDFIRNMHTIMDVSEGVRYVRPGSRLARQRSDTT